MRERLARRWGVLVDVTDFGADPTGATDCTDAFNTAIAAIDKPLSWWQRTVCLVLRITPTALVQDGHYLVNGAVTGRGHKRTILKGSHFIFGEPADSSTTDDS